MNNNSTKISLWLTLSLFTITCFSQSIPDALKLPSIIPPSPTVAGLMSFEEVPVDLYTGQPDISIPLYTKKLNSELSFPLVLKYSTSGLRVSERSSWIGVGWSLDAGGSVSRTVRGAADESLKTGPYKTTGVFHNPKFWTYSTSTDKEKNEFIWNVGGTSQDVYDSQPDLFQFSVLGISGRFIIIREGSDLVAKQLSEDQRLIIDVAYDHTSMIISGFTVTDGNGYVYEFGGSDAYIESTISTPFTIIFRQKQEGGVAPEEQLPPISVRSAWHLKSIKTSNGIELAAFTYTASEETYASPTTIINNEIVKQGVEYNLILENSQNSSWLKPRSIVSSYTTVASTKKLSSIDFKDGTYLSFILTSQGSNPDTHGVYLDKVYLKHGSPGGTTVRTFDLVHTTTATNRLWLTDVIIDGIEKYSLDYFEKETFPDALTQGDAWGYTNGDFRAVMHPTEGFNYYDFAAHKRGILNKITYPTGGTKSFFYESNNFSYEGDVMITDYSSNPQNVSPLTYSKVFNVNNNGSQNGGTFTLTHLQYVYLTRNSLTGDATKFQIEIDGPTQRSFRLDELVGGKIIQLSAGTYTVTVRTTIEGSLIDPPSINVGISIQYGQMKDNSLNGYSHYLLGGGPRISYIEFNDPLSTDSVYKRRITYEYLVKDLTPHPSSGIYALRSSGAIDSKVGKLLKKYNCSEAKYLYTSAVSDHYILKKVTYDVNSYERTSQLTRGNFVGYKNVRVSEREFLTLVFSNPTTGYTDYVYTTARDFPSPPQTFTYPFVSPPNLDFKRGLLLSKTVYDGNSNKLEETINPLSSYVFPETTIAMSLEISPSETCGWKQFYDFYQNYCDKQEQYPMICQTGGGLGTTDCFGTDYNNCGDIGGGGAITPYNASQTLIKSGHAELLQSTTTQYPNGTSNGITKTNNYAYNPANFQIKSEAYTITEGATTNTYKTEYEYPVGGYTTSLFPNTNEQANIAQMDVLNIVNKPIVITTLKNTTVLQRVINKYAQFATNQMLLNEVETLKGGSPDTTGEDRVIYKKYDSKGNILELHKANGTRICYIWTYSNTLPAAKIETADAYYTDTQFMYDAILPNLKSSINNAGTDTVLRDALNNLRNAYATNANMQVTTFLYDHVSRLVTEVTDPKGDFFTYKYDVLGRLESVKDSGGLLISENVYHYRP